jgi:hypothetical protein
MLQIRLIKHFFFSRKQHRSQHSIPIAPDPHSSFIMLFATSFSKSNWNKMLQDESPTPQSPSRTSKLKLSGSSKSESSTQTAEVKLKRKMDKKKEPKSKESKSKDSKTEKRFEQVIPIATPVHSTYEDKSSTVTPEEKLKLKREKKDKKARKQKKEEKKEKESKSTSSCRSKTETRSEQIIPTATAYLSKSKKMLEPVIPTAASVSSNHKDKASAETPAEKVERKSKMKESKSKNSSETPEEKAQRRKEKKDKKQEKEKTNKKEVKDLMCTIKTLQLRVEEVESENRHLNEQNTAMQELETHLNQAEEQLEYATEENNEFSARVHALEQALIGQETELDNALATIRKQKKRERKLLEAERTVNSVVGDAELACHAQVEQQLAYREELDAVQEEVELLRHERDEAIGRAITLSMETAALKAEVSDSSDRVTECKIVIEQLRTLTQNKSMQQSSSASVCSVSKKMDRRTSTSSVSSFSGLPISIRLNTIGSLWGYGNKDDDKSIVSKYDDDCMLDQTEDNTDGSEEDWDLEQTEFPEQASVLFC